MFKKLPFYNTPVEKPKIKKLNNVDVLDKVKFYDELNIVKTDSI